MKHKPLKSLELDLLFLAAATCGILSTIMLAVMVIASAIN